MNICLVSTEFPPDNHTGGIGTLTAKTARGLTDLGHRVCVITETRRQPSSRLEDGVLVVRLPPPTLRPYILGRARAVAHSIRNLPFVPDIVQASEFGAEGLWYAFRKQRGVKFVTHLCTPRFIVERLNQTSLDAGIRGRLRIHFVDGLERLQTLLSDAIVSETDALARIVCLSWRIPRKRIVTIAQGVDFANLFGSDSKLFQLPPILAGQDYLIYFGRLEQRKGVHILARALQDVLATYQGLHVVFVGEDVGYGETTMRAFVERCNEASLERLHFWPRLPQRELYPFLANALIAVLPSLWENLANTCLEALDMGLPVVATLGCGFGEVIENGRSGILVSPGDDVALRDSLINLLSDRGKLRSMAQAAKVKAEQYSLVAKSKELERYFEGLIE